MVLVEDIDSIFVAVYDWVKLYVCFEDGAEVIGHCECTNYVNDGCTE